MTPKINKQKLKSFGTQSEILVEATKPSLESEDPTKPSLESVDPTSIVQPTNIVDPTSVVQPTNIVDPHNIVNPLNIGDLTNTVTATVLMKAKELMKQVEPSDLVEPTETVESVDQNNMAFKKQPAEKNYLAETNVPPKPVGQANKIINLLETCVCGLNGKTTKNIPLCHASLQTVQVTDLHAFKKDHPEANTLVETKMSRVMAELQPDEKYRAIGVYLALLLQDIDLAHESTGPLGQGAAGEVCQRLAGVVQQSLMARDARQQKAVPGWCIIALVFLGIILIALLFITGSLLALSIKAIPKKIN